MRHTSSTSSHFPNNFQRLSTQLPINFHPKLLKLPSNPQTSTSNQFQSHRAMTKTFLLCLYAIITADVMPSTRLSSLSVARQSPQEQRQEVGECLCFGHVWNMMITFPPPRRPENRYSHLKFVRHNQSVHATCFLPQIDC
jgi:hypothetical protein